MENSRLLRISFLKAYEMPAVGVLWFLKQVYPYDIDAAKKSVYDRRMLDVLIAKWCYGRRGPAWEWADSVPSYSTDGREMVKLMVRFSIDANLLNDGWGSKFKNGNDRRYAEDPCLSVAITALFIALKEAAKAEREQSDGN